MFKKILKQKISPKMNGQFVFKEPSTQNIIHILGYERKIMF